MNLDETLALVKNLETRLRELPRPTDLSSYTINYLCAQAFTAGVAIGAEIVAVNSTFEEALQRIDAVLHKMGVKI